MALKVNPLAEEPLYLLAHIADERGDINAAKSFLKKIIYLFLTVSTLFRIRLYL
jgi:hypothetical protein